jgi:hypothetical protein
MVGKCIGSDLGQGRGTYGGGEGEQGSKGSIEAHLVIGLQNDDHLCIVDNWGSK